MMKKSFDILNNHPLNVQRAKEGKNKAIIELFGIEKSFGQLRYGFFFGCTYCGKK